MDGRVCGGWVRVCMRACVVLNVRLLCKGRRSAQRVMAVVIAIFVLKFKILVGACGLWRRWLCWRLGTALALGFA